MAHNNDAFYDAVIAAGGGAQQAWVLSQNAGTYASFATAVATIATAVDLQIPAIVGGPSLSQIALLTAITQNVFAARFTILSTTTTLAAFADVAKAIAAIYNAVSPSLTNSLVIYGLYPQGRAAVMTALNADPATPVLVQTLTGLAPSKKYNLTLGARAVIQNAVTPSSSGSLDLLVDLYVTTDVAAVATCSLQNTPITDTNRLPLALATTILSVAPSAGGFTLSVTRPAGVNCLARGLWWTAAAEELV